MRSRRRNKAPSRAPPVAGTPGSMPRCNRYAPGYFCMGKSEDYRRFAQECLEMANTTENPQVRATLLQMAQVWLRLAQEHAGDKNKQQD